MSAVEFNPAFHDLLATCSIDGSIRIWDYKSASTVKILDSSQNNRLFTIAFSPDGEYLASGGDDGVIRIWNLINGNVEKELVDHTDIISSLYFSPNGSELVSGSKDGTIKIWRINESKTVRTIHSGSSEVNDVKLFQNKVIFSAVRINNGEALSIFDYESGKKLAGFEGHSNSAHDISISSNASIFASAGSDETIRIQNLETHQLVHVCIGHTARISSIDVNPNGDLLVSGSEDETIRLWDTKSGKCIKILSGYINPVWSLSWNKIDNFLAIGSSDNFIRIWNVQDKKWHKAIKAHKRRIRALSYNLDGSILFSGSGDRSLRAWEGANFNIVKLIGSHRSEVMALAISPDSKLIVSGSYRRILIWDIHSSKIVTILHKHKGIARSICFNPDGTLLAIASDDKNFRIWDTNSWECVCEVSAHSKIINKIAFNPNGNLLFTSGNDNIVIVWNVSTFQIIAIFESTRQIKTFSVHPNEEILVLGSERNIEFWNIPSHKKYEQLSNVHENRIRAIEFNSLGKLFASGSQDGTIKIWDFKTLKLLDTIFCNKPYDGINITDCRGLNQEQKASLIKLGAIENQV